MIESVFLKKMALQKAKVQMEKNENFSHFTDSTSLGWKR